MQDRERFSLSLTRSSVGSDSVCCSCGTVQISLRKGNTEISASYPRCCIARSQNRRIRFPVEEERSASSSGLRRFAKRFVRGELNDRNSEATNDLNSSKTKNKNKKNENRSFLSHSLFRHLICCCDAASSFGSTAERWDSSVKKSIVSKTSTLSLLHQNKSKRTRRNPSSIRKRRDMKRKIKCSRVCLLLSERLYASVQELLQMEAQSFARFRLGEQKAQIIWIWEGSKKSLN